MPLFRKPKHAGPKKRKPKDCTAPGCMGAGVIHKKRRDGSFDVITCKRCGGSGKV